MTFTQPLCDVCWDAENPDRPVRPDQPRDHGPLETCCLCGESTKMGIYTRRDPATVPFPRMED